MHQAQLSRRRVRQIATRGSQKRYTRLDAPHVTHWTHEPCHDVARDQTVKGAR